MRIQFGLVLLMIANVAWAQKPLVFAPLPMQKPDEVVAQMRPMLKYLENELGIEIQIRYMSSYQDVMTAFGQGQVDLAYLGPLPYVSLKKQYPPATPLVHFKEGDGKASYSCALIATDKTVLTHKQPLTIALTQSLSTCGYLSVAGLLALKGIDIEAQHYRYLGAHDKAALSVVNGEYDLAGVKTAIAHKYDNLGLTILQETEPMPSFALVANASTLSSSIQNRIVSALGKLDPIRDAALMQAWGDAVRNGVVEAKDDDYRVVRALMSRDSLPEKGNF